MSNLVYDGSWLVTLSNNIQAGTGIQDPVGVFTGNGKLAAYVATSNIGVNRCMISGNAQLSKVGKYVNNTIDIFQPFEVSFGSPYGNNVSFVHQSLDMSKAKVSTCYNVIRDGVHVVTATNNIMPLRQYPYCVLQTITFSVTESYQSNVVDLYHIVKAPTSLPLTNIRYTNNVTYNEDINQNEGIYTLQATGKHQQHDCEVTTASCYLIPEETGARMIGFNAFADKSSAYQKIRFINVTPGVDYVVYVLTAMMTSFDFDNIIDESQRILLNIIKRSATLTSVIESVITDHTTMWTSLWQTGDVDIRIRQGTSTVDAYKIQTVRKHIRLSLFNIYACLRESVRTELNALNLSFVDTDGSIFFDGDLWLLPLLLMIRPSAARMILERKYRLLEQATQLAESLGYSGSKFPYRPDVLGYKTVYWDVVSPLQIFNNAAIVVNIWNYYRVTQDLQWLTSKGYPMMRSIVDFLVSFLQKSQGYYNVHNVVGLGTLVCNNHAFTINMILMAILAIQQASNLLSYSYDPAWYDILRNLILPITTNVDSMGQNIVLFHSTYTGNTQLDILDNLVTLLPLFNEIYSNSGNARTQSDVVRNLTFYIPRIKPDYQNHPLNNLMLMGLWGRVAQTYSTNVTDFENMLMNVINNNVVGTWGYMNAYNDPLKGNDISLNAMFVLMIITCICQLRFKGSANPSNTLVESYGLNISELSSGVYMPYTWASIFLRATQSKLIYNATLGGG